MRKIVLFAAVLALMAAPALAQPLPEVSPSGEKQLTDYAYTSDYLCDVWVFHKDTAVEPWLLECIEAGFRVRKTSVEGYTVYQAEDDQQQYAMLFPSYSGAMMLMVPKGMAYAFEKTTPAPQPPAAPEPVNYHWESVLVENDCPACVGGVCDLCKGTGVYRLYGTASECSPICTVCDGEGTYTTTKTVKVYD